MFNKRVCLSACTSFVLSVDPVVLLLLAVLLTGARCQTLYGLSLAPGEDLTQLVTPTTSLSLTFYWTDTGNININGLIDGATPVDPDATPVQATKSSQGSAVITINRDSLSLGR